MKRISGIITIVLLFIISSVSLSAETQSQNKVKTNRHEKINYVEFPSKNLEVTKKFFGDAFGWSFAEYGPEYIAFTGKGLDGGFYKSDLNSSTKKGSALIVFYSSELEATKAKIEKAGGKIIKPIFSFPGGQRFHFADPNGNEYACWSE